MNSLYIYIGVGVFIFVVIAALVGYIIWDSTANLSLGDSCDSDDQCTNADDNAVCYDGVCSCKSGYTQDGSECKVEDACADVNCVNGSCVDGVCECDGGWSGSACDVCPSGYTQDGSECTLDSCADKDCGNGKCVDGVCECNVGWDGSNCDRCSDAYSGDNCNVCADGYNGDPCEPNVYLTYIQSSGAQNYSDAWRFDDAQDYVAELGGRMPTVDELQAMDSSITHNRCDAGWTAEQYAVSHLTSDNGCGSSSFSGNGSAGINVSQTDYTDDPDQKFDIWFVGDDISGREDIVTPTSETVTIRGPYLMPN